MDKNLSKAPVNEEFTIENRELLNNLLTLAIICATNGTDNCDLTIKTSKGDIGCHIEFSGHTDFVDSLGEE